MRLYEVVIGKRKGGVGWGLQRGRGLKLLHIF